MSRRPRGVTDYAVDERSFTCTKTFVDQVEAPGIQYPSAIGCGPTTSGKDGDAHDLLVVDGSNRLYLLDKQGVCRKTIGGPGGAPGNFLNPRGLAVSDDGQFVYVADTGNDRVQRFRVYDSQLQAIAGGKPRPGFVAESYGLKSLPGNPDKPKRYKLESLNQPHGIAILEEMLYVCDTWNHRIVVLSTSMETNFAGLARATSDEAPCIPELEAITYWGSKGRAAGCFFQYPKGVCVSPGDEALGHPAEVIVADTRNHRIQCFTLDGEYTRGVSGGGAAAGSNMPGRMSGTDLFSFPTNVCISSQRLLGAPAGGHLFVADQRSITVLDLAGLEPLCMISLSNPTRLASARPTTCTAAALCTHAPAGAGGALPLYVAEYDEHAVREVLLKKEDLRNPQIEVKPRDLVGGVAYREPLFPFPRPHAQVIPKSPRAAPIQAEGEAPKPTRKPMAKPDIVRRRTGSMFRGGASKHLIHDALDIKVGGDAE